MSNQQQSSLGILNILSTAYELNKQTIKEASRAGDLSLSQGQEKQASPNQTPAENERLDYMLRLGQTCGVVGETLEKSASGRAMSQPASSHGPRDNEIQTVHAGHFKPTTAAMKTGRTGMETDQYGKNYVGTDEPRTGLAYTQGSSALPKTAASDFLQKAAFEYQLGTNGKASGQPASTLGARDNETGSISSNISRGFLSGSPMRVAHLTAQELAADAQSRDFPFNEPQAHEITAESGLGAGNIEGASDGPTPNKTASSAKGFLMALAQKGGAR